MTQQSQKQHQKRQQKLKQQVDDRIAQAQDEKGVLQIITGNGKGKTTSGFGMVIRALGHGLQAGVVQFIKGQWDNGERNLLANIGVPFAVMETGFTWETQNKEADTLAAQQTWQEAKAMLANPEINMILLDELTYMVSYGYIEVEEVVAVLKARPRMQHVVITGRGAHRELIELADTVSEVRNVKHAFDAGVKAQVGFDY